MLTVKGIFMARKDMHSFKRHQKELKRKEKAVEKLARRQGKKEQASKDIDEQDHTLNKTDNL
jgi:hypothetical protein